jgi:PAP2 superfamily
LAISCLEKQNNKNMKHKYPYYLLLAVALFLAYCSKVDPFPADEAYTFSSADEKGGSWHLVLLSDVKTIALDAPKQVTSPEYVSEVAAVKQATQAITSEQISAVQYWGTNALVRWNEIARELAAKYNLPPVANPDGTYPVPNAANPGVYPYFPFSNPVYSARMYAYWSAAQYDALITAWHYKYQYNRQAPYVADAAITPLLRRQNVPSYPSEDAVIASVSKAILTAMFPLEADYLQKKAAEHRNSRLWAGMNTESDLIAGETIGKAVAAQFINRSKTDGMKNAVGNQAQWDSLETATQAKYGWHWESMEAPQRPAMLPFFGRVKPWCIPDVATVRPPAPPAPGSPEFEKAVQELKEVSKNLTTEQRRIANYWGDGVSTYTPPGHWNRIASEKMIEAQFNPLRSARTFAYLNMTLMDCGVSCWDTKTYYFYPRPSQVIPGFRSILGLPNFPSYTSGHSTFSSGAATILSHIFPQHTTAFQKDAKDASESRIYGGIHFRFDCEVGLEVGRKIGEYTINIARRDGGE